MRARTCGNVYGQNIRHSFALNAESLPRKVACDCTHGAGDEVQAFVLFSQKETSQTRRAHRRENHAQ